MTLVMIALTAARLAVSEPETSGECGWLVLSGDSLVEQPEPSLQPLDPRPLPTPPALARAAYCVRSPMMTNVGDERVLKLGLPLIIRSGGREGVLEANPTVMFNYHKVENRYLPGRVSNRNDRVITAR